MSIPCWLKGRAAKWTAAAALIIGLGLTGAVLAAHLPCVTGCARASAPSAAFLKDHIAAMRMQIAHIHKGKVDAATMRRIETEMVRMHGDAIQTEDGGSAFATGMPEQPQNRHLSVQIARYLSAPDSRMRPVPASWNLSAEIQVAQNMAVPPTRAARPPPPAADSATDNRVYVGQKTCETCHQQEAGNWAHTVHAKVFDLHPRDAIEARGCEACHGPGSDHIKNPADLTTIISFSSKSRTPVPLQNAQCLSCHQGGQRIFWHDSIHESNNLSCSDCHNPMTSFASHGLTARESINDTCFQCHKVQRAQFAERSHMPLLEGKMTCVDCHNPHGSTTAPLLKADSVNEVCYSCHADKRGPFLFEHAPVRENCVNCHSPHGSNFEALLTTPRPVLCQQCHSQDGHPAQLLTSGNLPRGPMPDPRLISTSCQTCHVNVHGSNDPSGARFER